MDVESSNYTLAGRMADWRLSNADKLVGLET